MLLAALTSLWTRVAAAAEPRRASVVVEVDAIGERLVDSRAVRRLIALELSDVDVPANEIGSVPALFYRVLGDARGFIELELWERGTLLGNRRVSSTARGGHLFARRVALAAAELARALRQQRQARRRLEARRLAREHAERFARMNRTLEGPTALASFVGGGRGRDFTWAGSGLRLEQSLREATRLDLGARWFALDVDGERLRLFGLELSLGPAQRLRLSPALDLDLSAALAASVVHASGARGVDAIAGQDETWTARALLGARLQPRLSRWMRASFGLEAGHFLRAVPVALDASERFAVKGPYVGLELGLVLTPP